uniref:Maternal effect embryo arrest 22 n=2 Tax=Rhizophora mucronata TaxID=61149 RepID=A0A2P2JK50_RHIMU
MAADVPVKQPPLNPCCASWNEKYTKLLERRNALKQAINVLSQQVDKVQAENLSLKKTCDLERGRVETETKEKEKELAARVALENKISALRSEISSLRLNGNADGGDKTGELEVLQDQVSQGKKEINWLKKLLEEEKIRADSEWKNTEAEKKSVAETLKQVKELKTRAEKERKCADTEAKKANEYQLQLETLKKEANEAKSQLIIQTVKFEESNKRLEAEKHKLNKERKWVDSEKAKLDELQKLAEVNAKKTLEEKSRVDSLSQQLEDAQRTIEGLQKADEERKHGDVEVKKAEEYQLQLGELRKEIDEVKSKLAIETVKSEKANKKLEAEKRKVAKERKHACSEMAKVGELERIVEVIQKKVMEKDSHTESLSRQLESALRTIKDLRKVDEERMCVNIKEKKADEYWCQLEALKKEAEETKSKLATETLKLEEANRKFEEEENKMTREREITVIEMAKADEQRHLLERKLMEEKSHAESLRRQLADSQLTTEKLQKEMHMFMSSINLSEVPCDQPNGNCNVEAAKIRYQLWLETLKKDAYYLRLALEFLKSDVVTNNFDFDSKKYLTEKQSADMDMVKAEEKRKLLEIHMKVAMEERSRADQLAHQLEEYRKKVELLEKEMQKLLSSRKGVQSTGSLTKKDLNSQREKMKHLEKQLKLVKIRLKTTKEVAKLEKARQTMLQQELSHLKLDFDQISGRLDVLDKYFPLKYEGTKHRRKAVDFLDKKRQRMKRKISQVESFGAYHENEVEPLRPWCTAVTSSAPLGQTIDCTAPLLPVSGGNHMELTSGIHSKLEPLLGGSNKKLLQPSAINSSSASFSDGQLVGSQERDAITTAPGNLMEDNFNVHPTMSSISAEVTKSPRNENLAVVAENSVKSPHSTDIKQLEHGKKKRICDAIESIECLRLEGKKLHLQMEANLSILNDMLSKQIIKPLEESMTVEPNMQSHSVSNHHRLYKKRKVSHVEKVIKQSHIDKLKSTEGIWNGIQDDANKCRQNSSCANHLMLTHLACKEGLSNSFGCGLESVAVIEEVTNGNYLKLLELDDPADEECYRKARELPMSPSLPDIEFSTGEIFGRDEIEPLVEGIFHRGLLFEKEVPVPSHCFDVIDMEIISNGGKCGSSGTYRNELLQGDVGSLNYFDIRGNKDDSCGAIRAAIISDSQAPHSVVDGKVSNLPGSGVEREFGPAHGNIPMYCVIFSNINDAGSISRIIYATKTSMASSSLDSQLVSRVQKILLGLKMQDILPREKACAVFSTLLLSFSVFTWGKTASVCGTNFVTCLDLFGAHLNAVMSDGEGRNLFAEVCCLDELLGLIEDFLMNRRVLVYVDASSSGLADHESGIEVLLDGININLSSKAASDDQLLAGSIILGSICVAIGHFDAICDAAYNLLWTWRCNPVLLAILHVFAYLGGNKFFSLHENSLMMTVLKSVVLFLEGRNMPLASTSTCLFAACPGAKCPFMEDALSVDDIRSILLDSIQNYAGIGTMHQHQMDLSHLSNSSVLCPKLKAVNGYKQGHCVLDSSCDASCCLKKCVIAVTDSTSAANGTLCDLSDLLSLLELLACNVNWEWTHDKVIAELLKLLESHGHGNFTIAVVVLLGQLGRLGVAAHGYDDERVENVRCKISSFLWRDANIRAALPVQIAIVNALLGLLSVDFENLTQCNLQFSAGASQSVYRTLIRDWFSLLSKEQQDLSSSLLQSAGVHMSEMMTLMPS